MIEVEYNAFYAVVFLVILTQILPGNYLAKMKHDTHHSESIIKKSSLDDSQSIKPFSAKSTHPKGYGTLKVKYTTSVQKQHSLNTAQLANFQSAMTLVINFVPIHITYKFQIYRYTKPVAFPFFTIKVSACYRVFLLCFPLLSRHT